MFQMWIFPGDTTIEQLPVLSNSKGPKLFPLVSGWRVTLHGGHGWQAESPPQGKSLHH